MNTIVASKFLGDEGLKHEHATTSYCLLPIADGGFVPQIKTGNWR